jgi:hypothetical protein
MRRRWVLVLPLALAACGPPGPPATQNEGAAGTPGEPVSVTVDTLLARGSSDAEVLLRTSVVRSHPLGSRLEPFLLAWPGWGATLASLTPHPLSDLDWLAIVGPRDPARQRMATRTLIDDDVVDARLRARSDRTLRVVVRGQPHLVVAVPPDDGPAMTLALPRSRLIEPHGEADEALFVEAPNPQALLPLIPSQAKRIVARIYSRPGGGAEATAEIACDDETSAKAMAALLQERLADVNGLVVRMLTHDLLGGLSVAAAGHNVELRLPATREQLESLAALASGLLAPIHSAEGRTTDGRKAVPP